MVEFKLHKKRGDNVACSLEKSWKKSTHFAFCGSLDSICPAKCLDSSPDGEMVDAEDSKSSSSGVRVQVPLGAPIKHRNTKSEKNSLFCMDLEALFHKRPPPEAKNPPIYIHHMQFPHMDVLTS
jgi:hypothetical protein